MPMFSVFRDKEGELKSTKLGWNWVAAIVPELFYLANRLWIPLASLLLFAGVIKILANTLIETSKPNPFSSIVLGVAARLVVAFDAGANGTNRMMEKNCEESLCVLESDSANDALSKYLDKEYEKAIKGKEQESPVAQSNELSRQRIVIKV